MGWPENWGWFKIINDSKMDREARRILAQLGVKLRSTHEKVSNLSGVQRQLISIARVLTHSVKLVIVDEPNVLLTYPYQQRLLDLIQKWRENRRWRVVQFERFG